MSEKGKVNIKGKEYETVAYRVNKFKTAFPDWALTSQVIYRDDKVVVMRACINDDKGVLRATGHAEEYRSASQINATSALENCETSAWGRALAALGMSGGELCSADELVRALTAKEKAPTSQDVYGTATAMKEKYKEILAEIEACESFEELKAVASNNATHVAALKAIDQQYGDDIKAAAERQKKKIADNNANQAAFGQEMMRVK